MAVTVDAKNVVERVWEDIVNAGNLDAAYDLAAADYVYRGPGGIELNGPEGFQRLIEALRTVMPDLVVDVHEYIEDGNRVASRWTANGTYDVTGEPIRMRGATITHVADGKMVDDWEYWDRLEIAEQVATGWLESRIVARVAERATKRLPHR